MSAVARADAPPTWLAGIAGVLFAASAATTIAWARSMSAMDMPMPGGWTMSMAWMRMPDQTWAGAAASFTAMWIVMMIAMMLPVLAPALRRYAAVVAGVDGARVGSLTAVAGAAYFAVYGAASLVIFPAGAALAAIEMAQPAIARAVPFAMAAVLLAAGAVQFTAAKARALACCGAVPGHDQDRAAGVHAAWRHGLRLGIQCLCCCGNLMAVLLVLGVMDLGVMAAVTVAITAERVGTTGVRAARLVGAGIVLAGVVQFARAAASL